MRWGIVASAALVALVLSGCTASTVDSDLGDELLTSTVATASLPGFLAEEQSEEDVIPGFDVATFPVDPATVQYQGEWEGENFLPGVSGYDIYLGVAVHGSVQVITVPVDHPEMWSAGSASGNTVIGLGEPMTLQYLPQGTATPPDGWHSLSDWIIVRD